MKLQYASIIRTRAFTVTLTVNTSSKPTVGVNRYKCKHSILAHYRLLLELRHFTEHDTVLPVAFFSSVLPSLSLVGNIPTWPLLENVLSKCQVYCT